jgi:hypothetical protein
MTILKVVQGTAVGFMMVGSVSGPAIGTYISFLSTYIAIRANYFKDHVLAVSLSHSPNGASSIGSNSV